MGLVVLAKDVILADVLYLKGVGRPVEKIEVGVNLIRFWFSGYSSALAHPYDVVGVERAN